MSHLFRSMAIYLPLLLATVSCSPDPETAPPDNADPGIETTAEPNISVVRTDRSTETIYSVKTESCEIQWTVHKTEVNRGVIQHRAYCSRPLPEQIPLMTRILAKILQTDEAAQDFKTLFWGRLDPDTQGTSTDMSFRLALAAAQSPLWDVRHGKPVQGHETTVVVQLAKEAMIYPELKSLFSQFGKEITFSGAEKVLVMEAQSLPFFSLLQQQGVKPTDRLPFDCLTWFSVESP